MKWQGEFILFIICLNLATGLTMELALPGTSQVSTIGSPLGSNATDYPEQFNATEVAEGWDFPPTIGLPVVGDIWSGFGFLTRMISYVLVGFPLFLTWLGDSFLVGAETVAAWNILKTVILALFSVVMVTFFIWFISGRDI